MFRPALLVPLACAALAQPAAALPAADELQTAAGAILAIGPEGRGNEAAAGAWKILARTGPDRLDALFAALDRAGPVPANYLRCAIEVALENAGPDGRQKAAGLLRGVLLDRSRSVNSRNLAYEWLSASAPATSEDVLPGLLDDPSEFLRRHAVDGLLQKEVQAAGGDPAATRTVLLKALHHARDPEQVRGIAQRLEKLGSPVDLPRHFGFLTHWQVIGPFDNAGREGFARPAPPETDPDPSRSHPGKHGPVSWKPYATSDPFGKVDLNQALGMEKEVVGYALAEFDSAGEREVELRLGTKNAWKLWLNGKLLFERDEYHRGQRIDQYRLKATLRSGRNLILVKCCQNEEVKDWTVEWEFQLRVCDATGTAVLAANRLPTPKAEPARRRPAPATPAAKPSAPASKPAAPALQ